MTTADQHADAIMVQIHEDMERPFPWGKQIPRDVGSFSCLHDYVDANGYLIDALAAESAITDELWNEVADLVDRRLAAEALALGTGERCPCGRLARFANGHVLAPRVTVTHVCSPCQFCKYCPTCRRPLECQGRVRRAAAFERREGRARGLRRDVSSARTGTGGPGSTVRWCPRSAF